MRVTIVTISYNQASYLERALQSVIQQGHDDLEYIVVDPGSTDGSRDIIEANRGDISRVILEPDDGPADGLNKGFAKATGELFGYLNADDEFLPGAVAQAAAYAMADDAADVIYGSGFVVDADGAYRRRFISDPFDLRRAVLGYSIIMQQATFMRSRAFARTDGFVPANRTTWDAELWVDLALSGAIFRRVPDNWALFRVHEETISSNYHKGDVLRRDQARMFEKVVGRPQRWWDRGRQPIARAHKHAVNLRSLMSRLEDRFVGPPDFDRF